MKGATLSTGEMPALPCAAAVRPGTARTRQLLAILLAAVLAGCAAPRTTVVLLPDEDGHVGAVSVSGAGGSRQLEQAFSATTVEARGAGPSAAGALQPEALQATFQQLMNAQPTKPKVFVLYFAFGKTELTPESKAMLPAVLEMARARKPTEISVFGHADSIGSDQINARLSAERAELVARLLKASDPSVGRIEVRWFGSKAPSQPTEPRGAQPKNRRAEVMIL